MATAAAANGTLTPPPAPVSPAPVKRKHIAKHAASDKSASLAQGTTKVNGSSTYTLQNALQDIYSVLQNYDTDPSILDHPNTSAITRSSTGEADAKRAKLTPPTVPATIAGLIRDGSYNSLQALVKDAENAIADIEASRISDSSDGVASPAGLKLQAQISAFHKILTGLAAREEARLARSHPVETCEDVENKAPATEEASTEVKEEEDEAEPSSRTVLTLYGTANGPKQLFSSLQQTHTVRASGSKVDLDSGIKIILPLRESALPNILSTTEVYPITDHIDSNKKTVTTIGDVFRAPAHLPQISPPKAPKPTTAKGNVITFAPQETSKSSRKGSYSYTTQNLSAGFWLGYSGVDMPKDQTSPTAKQKSRQRALSMGESQQPPSETILVAIREAKEDALFRSAYSSFAPTHDDALAIIPEETKNRLWWKRVGEKRFNELFPIDLSFLEGDKIASTAVNGHVEEDEEFKEAVENFVPIDEANPPWLEEKSEEDKDADEILTDISELLETLASHQRIRNSSLTTNPRTPVVQNSSLASLVGSPSTPSTEEVDVYNILKSQLALLISQLPPYAVAKLNGDQLEELNISRTILLDTKEYKGVLEEDPLSKLSKASAASTAPPATLNRSSSGAHTHFPPGGTQYARPTPAHNSSSRTVQGSQSYFPQQSLSRSSSMQFQRSPSGQTQTFQPGGVSYTPAARPGLPANQSYNQQTPRPGYGQSSSQYYTPRPAQPGSYSSNQSSQYYNATPQAQSQQRQSGQSMSNGVYSRSQPVAPMYSTSQNQQNRTASPLKASSTSAHPMYSSRSGMSTPVSGGQLRSTYFGPSQYGTSQATSTSTSSAGYNGMSSAAQQMMIDRQQAQVTAQSQARLAAQNSFNRQGSGTPQPSNGTYGGQANGVSLPN